MGERTMYYRLYSKDHDLHLTIIAIEPEEHAKINQEVKTILLDSSVDTMRPYTAKGIDLATFGQLEKPVEVIRVVKDEFLICLRAGMEVFLEARGIKWKTLYDFVPHVTIWDGQFRKEILFTHAGWALSKGF
jgi:2'-5' RNA ligase